MSTNQCLGMEWLPHEVVEDIMMRLPVKSLRRFKAVAKQWRSTIESPFFQNRQLTYNQKSGDPNVFILSIDDPDNLGRRSLRTLVLGSSSLDEIPTPWDKEDVNVPYLLCGSSCDSLVCLYHSRQPGFVINPRTRWYRALPLCNVQLLNAKLRHTFYELGFGKDKFTGTYKPVWLYNSKEFDLDNATTCEVFDFSTNLWRYVTPASPYPVVGSSHLTDVDGSLHWFTQCEETKIVSFNLHTEAFRVISNAPFGNARSTEMVMCNLNNRLCVSNRNGFTQVIWSFNSGNQTWDNMCSIDVGQLSLDMTSYVRLPLALLDAEKKTKKKRLLLSGHFDMRNLMTHELATGAYRHVFSAKFFASLVCYFPSLISIQ